MSPPANRPAGPGIREAREEDVEALARLYAGSARALGPERYAPEAVEAWAAFADEPEFREFVLGARTYVAEDASGIVGFGGVDETGRIRSLYVRGDRARRGIGAALLSTLLEAGRAMGVRRFHAEASELSRPVFERFGFAVVGREVVERRGVDFTRILMERSEGP